MTPIAIAFTPNYFVPAAVMLKSLLNATRDKSGYHVICLVSEEIPEEMQAKLATLGKGRLEFEYIPLGGKLEGVYTDPRYTEAASFRLLLPELLPQYDSIVYIDCDVVVRQNIAQLFKTTDLGGHWLGVVYEAPIESQAERIKALGCKATEYFHSGFLLMNLKQMRKDNVSERLLDACRVDWMEFPDQDALNRVCQGHVLPLSPLYNGIRTFFIPKYRDDFKKQYSLYLWYEVQDKATIHYTGGKPWNSFTVKFGEWWRTYDSLPEDIRQEWIPDARILRLWKFYRTRLGQNLLDTARSIVRLFK